MATIGLTVGAVADLSRLKAALGELKQLLPVDRSSLPELLLGELNHFAEFPAEAIRVELENDSTLRATELKLVAHPSDRFLELLAALRARQNDGCSTQGQPPQKRNVN